MRRALLPLVAISGCYGASPYLLSGAATFGQAISVQAQSAAQPAPAPAPVVAPTPPPWPDDFEPPASPAGAFCATALYPYRQRRAVLRFQKDFASAFANEAEMASAWSQCEAEFYRRRQDETAAREQAEEERRRVALAVAERERVAKAEEASERDRAEAEPAPDAPQSAPAPPRKITAADRKRAAERKAERERKRADAEASAEQFKTEYCGPAPERSKWDGIYVGLERAFKTIAHDPDSIDFAGCTDADLRNPPVCWRFSCDVRGKNAFGAKVLSSYGFRKTAKGYFQN